MNMSQEALDVTENEAAAVAAAIGLDAQKDQAQHRQSPSPLVHVQSADDAAVSSIDNALTTAVPAEHPNNKSTEQGKT